MKSGPDAASNLPGADAKLGLPLLPPPISVCLVFLELASVLDITRNDLLPGRIIFTVWTAFWWTALFSDAYLHIRDLTLFAVPMKHYMMERFASAELPRWTPCVSGGMPFLADPSNQVFYPPKYYFFSARAD